MGFVFTQRQHQVILLITPFEMTWDSFWVESKPQTGQYNSNTPHVPLHFCACSVECTVWVMAYFEPWRLSWCICHWSTLHYSSLVENIPAKNKWRLGGGKTQSNSSTVNQPNKSNSVKLTVYSSIKLTQQCAVTGLKCKQPEERGTKHSSPTPLLTCLSGVKNCPRSITSN